MKEELINKVSVIGEGDSWREEKTGLHEWEFIETKKTLGHWTKFVIRMSRVLMF